MAIETRHMIFLTQSGATAAATSIANKALPQQAGASTVWLDAPFQMTADPTQRWALRYPKDVAWMADVDPTTFTTSTDVGTAPIGEGGAVPTVSAPLALRDQFSPTEVEAITCAATKEMVTSNYTTGKLQVLMDTLDAAATLALDTARVQGGFAYLVAAGLITSDRANAILSPVGILPQASWK